MFGGKDNRLQLVTTDAPPTDSHDQGTFEPTRISLGATIRGDVSAPGPVSIDGRVEGSVTAQGDIQIGPKGEVTGEVEGKNITLAGRLKGKLFADDKVHLLSGAQVEGDIHSQSLKIDDSVFFHGGCNMGEGARKRRADSKLGIPSISTNLKAA